MVNVAPLDWVDTEQTPISVIPHSTLGFIVLVKYNVCGPDGRCLGSLPNTGYYHSAHMSADAVVALVSDNRVHIYDLRRSPFTLVDTIISNDRPTCCALSATGRYITVCYAKYPSFHSMVLFEVGGNRTASFRFKRWSQQLCSVFSPCDGFVATGGADGIATVWCAKTRKPIVTLPHLRAVVAVAVSLDSARLATSSDMSLFLYSLRGENTICTHQIKLDTDGFGIGCAFSPIVPHLLATSGGQDATLQLWDAEKGVSLEQVKNCRAVDMQFLPGGQRLAVLDERCNVGICWLPSDMCTPPATLLVLLIATRRMGCKLPDELWWYLLSIFFPSIIKN